MKKTHRIYNELGLQLRNKTPKRRVKAKLRDDRRAASTSNEIWAMDFVHDQLATGRRFRVLTVVDTFSRFSPVIDPRFSYRAEDVVTALEGACASTGYPKTIRVDQGSEFVSRDLDLWAYAKGVTLDFSRPGKPTDNAFIEAFNGRLRAECLNAHWFLTLADARKKLEDWRKVLQRGSTAWGNRQQGPGFPRDSRRRIQARRPVTKAGKTLPSGGQQSGADQKAGKLYLPAVQQSGADHCARSIGSSTCRRFGRTWGPIIATSGGP